MIFACSYFRIRSFHGSFSQEKALVTGYEAANHALSYLNYPSDSHMSIIPVEPDEPHIVIARRLRKTLRKVERSLNPTADFFMI